MFVNGVCDNSIFNTLVTNENHSGKGEGPYNEERYRRIKGCLLRNKLRYVLQDHNMHRPRKSHEVQYDRSNDIDDTDI